MGLAVELALREREELRHERVEPLRRERTGVRRRQLLAEPPLAVRVVALGAVGLLDLPELRDELAAANRGPLSAEGLDALVTELLALTKRELDR